MDSSSSWTKDPNPWTTELQRRHEQYHYYGDQVVRDAGRAVNTRIQAEKERYIALKPTLSPEIKQHIG